MSVSAPCFSFFRKQENSPCIFSWDSFLGYYTRNKPLLAATLTIIALLFFIVLPAIALSGLALSVRRERLSRPPQTRVPPLVGLDYKTAESTLHNSKLNIRVLAHRYDPPIEPGRILFQTPQAGEFVDCGTVVGITISKENPMTMPNSNFQIRTCQ
jgi:PASTA domain